MTQTTSSPKNYNIVALRGGAVTDQEYVETFGLDPALAGTPALNDAMLDSIHADNISAGVEPDVANKKRAAAAKDIKRLLAMNGMLK